MSDGQTELAEQIEADRRHARAIIDRNNRRLREVNERLKADCTPMERAALLEEQNELLFKTDDSPEPPAALVGDSWMRANE